ncbi:MAG: hypothetical protein ACI9AT_000441 [Ulvibacter sp.]|jgi:hypothetical protein
MGWDAHSSAETIIKNDKLILSDSFIRKDFNKAAKDIVSKAGSIDFLFEVGGLDVSTCGKMLHEATGFNVYGDEWSVEMVKFLHKKADWDFYYPKEELWAYLSAKHFLALCAEHELSIEFTY